jgi:putative mRNA 3-end processing factor
LRTVEETGARRVLATHGYSEALARHLRSRGIEAGILPTPYKPEDED